MNKLTARERDVLMLVACGLTNREVGKELGISVNTVREQVRKLKKKLGAKNSPHAVALAFQRGILHWKVN